MTTPHDAEWLEADDDARPVEKTFLEATAELREREQMRTDREQYLPPTRRYMKARGAGSRQFLIGRRAANSRSVPSDRGD